MSIGRNVQFRPVNRKPKSILYALKSDGNLIDATGMEERNDAAVEDEPGWQGEPKDESIRNQCARSLQDFVSMPGGADGASRVQGGTEDKHGLCDAAMPVLLKFEGQQHIG